MKSLSNFVHKRIFEVSDDLLIRAAEKAEKMSKDTKLPASIRKDKKRQAEAIKTYKDSNERRWAYRKSDARDAENKFNALRKEHKNEAKIADKILKFIDKIWNSDDFEKDCLIFWHKIFNQYKIKPVAAYDDNNEFLNQFKFITFDFIDNMVNELIVSKFTQEYKIQDLLPYMYQDLDDFYDSINQDYSSSDIPDGLLYINKFAENYLAGNFGFDDTLLYIIDNDDNMISYKNCYVCAADTEGRDDEDDIESLENKKSVKYLNTPGYKVFVSTNKKSLNKDFTAGAGEWKGPKTTEEDLSWLKWVCYAANYWDKNEIDISIDTKDKTIEISGC